MSSKQSPQPHKTNAGQAKDMLLSLVIPCYNESTRVAVMLQGLAGFYEKWKGNWEAIIVDDGSKDDTVEKIETALAGEHKALAAHCRLEKMPKNGGKGSALKHGVSVAKGDYILTLDADMSTKPTDLLAWEKRDRSLFSGGRTIYIGSRKHEDGKVEALQSRRAIGSVFNGIVQLVTSLQLRDTQCGFKLYPAAEAHFLFGNMQSKGWEHDVELLYQADLNGIKIAEMPVNWVNMPESKVNVVRDSIKMLIGVMLISLRIWAFNTFLLPFRLDKNSPKEQQNAVWGRAIFNVLALLLLIVMPAMSFGYGVTGDEHWHFDYGNAIYNYFFHGDLTAQDGRLAGATDPTGIQYYGGIFDFLTAWVYHVFHPWDHYTVMHFFNALVGAIGIIYAGKLGRLFGGWGAAITTVVLLVFSPSWFGHNFANPKDIPFSAGYTAGIYFMICYLWALPRPTTRHLLGLIASIGWAMGVRIGGLLLIAYLVLFIATYAVYTRQVKDLLSKKVITQVILVGAAGYLIAILFWPYAHTGIISQPLEALKVMSNFFVNIGMLYEGKRILSNQVPWYYIPKYIAYTAPLVVLAGSMIGLVVFGGFLKKDRKMLFYSLALLFTIVFPVFYAIYKKSSLYDGWRHFLFIYPPIVVVAATGWQRLMAMKLPAVRFAAIGLVVLGILLPAKFMAANHPYESLYYNEIAGGLKGMYGNYETDYYMLGITEATNWLMEHEDLKSKRVTIGTNTTFPMVAAMYKNRYPHTTLKDDQFFERYADFRYDDDMLKYIKEHKDAGEPLPAGIAYVRYNNRYSSDWDYFIMFSRFVSAAQLKSGNWPPPETIHTVVVDGVPIAAILKRKTKKDLAGFDLMKEKKYDEAKTMFLESLKEYPQNEEVWSELARLYQAEDKPDSAILACQNVLKRDPADINAYQTLGSIYLKQQQKDKALQLYEQLCQYDAGYGHFFMAYTYAVTGNAPAAFDEIDKAIAADPQNDQAYRLGMQLAEQVRDMGRAQEYREKAEKVFRQP